MPWTTPRAWVANDVFSGPRINDIANDVKYIRAGVAGPTAVFKVASTASITDVSRFWSWPTLQATPSDANDLALVNYVKKEDDTALFVTFGVAFYVTAVAAVVAHALHINGVYWGGAITSFDPLTFSYPPYGVNVANSHQTALGSFKVKPLPKGTYSMHLCIKCGTTEAFTTARTYAVDVQDEGWMYAVEHWDAED